jgi:hypothetical protein
MPKFPGAVQKPISGGLGAFSSGPFKIVHHTTEGSSASGAFDAYKKNKSDPHFTVDETTIFQHVDTGVTARSLRPGQNGRQTNRDSAVQIEVVGFAHRAKSKATLKNVARLCRWIEATHGVPQKWPNGLPKPTLSNGKDPGGHNRSATTWDTEGGHYGHSQVPFNTHFDPGYTKAEADFVLEFDPSADLGEDFDSRFESIPDSDPNLDEDFSRMPDHADVGDPGASLDEGGAPLSWSNLPWAGLVLASLGVAVAFALAEEAHRVIDRWRKSRASGE